MGELPAHQWRGEAGREDGLQVGAFRSLPRDLATLTMCQVMPLCSHITMSASDGVAAAFGWLCTSASTSPWSSAAA